MEYQLFRDELISELMSRADEEEEIRVSPVLMNNDVQKESLMITQPGRNVCPVLYVQDLKEYHDRGVGMERIVEEVLKVSREGAMQVPAHTFPDDYRSYRYRVSMRLCSYEKNRAWLQEHPHRRFLDLAVIYLFPFYLNGRTKGTVLIRHEDLMRWGITEEDLYRDAMKNTPYLSPFSFKTMTETLMDDLPEGWVGDEDDAWRHRGISEDGTKVPMYVLSNEERFYGAASILYDYLLEDLSEELESDLYVIPSSVHEVILLRAHGAADPHEIEEMIREVNRSVVAEADILSDRLYLFRRESGMLEFALPKSDVS